MTSGARLARAPSPPRPLAERVPKRATLRRQYVLCGKAKCEKRHGPYWYAFWKEGGRTRSAYVGSDRALARFLQNRDGDLLDAPDDARLDDEDLADDRIPPAKRAKAPPRRVHVRNQTSTAVHLLNRFDKSRTVCGRLVKRGWFEVGERASPPCASCARMATAESC